METVDSSLIWRQADLRRYPVGHLESECGRFLAGPRKSDGGWEWCGPDMDWGMSESQDGLLTKEEALAEAQSYADTLAS